LTGVVEVQAIVGGEHGGTACGVEEEVAEVGGVFYVCGVGLEGFPFGCGGY